MRRKASLVLLAFAVFFAALSPLLRYYAYTVLTCDLRPLSRGEITLASSDPLVPPDIQPNYLSQPRDLERLVTSVKMARQILAQAPFAPHRAEEMLPGAAVQTDDQLRAWIREHAETVYHPVGSCKMGVDADPMAVVDPECRVRGIDGLRVVDAAVMPDLVGANINATVIMIAEKMADIIRGRPTLAPVNV